MINAYDPDVIVLELGMDTLAGDLLAHMSLTNNTYAEIIGELMRFDKAILATGGGGYDVEKTVRGWAGSETARCRFPIGSAGQKNQ